MKTPSVDLLVIGAGTAGMPCAMEAAAAGASVQVIEKANEVGGALWFSGGQMSAAGTRRQRAMGIEDKAEDHYADVLRMGGEPMDKSLVRRATELAPKTVDWLEDLGFPFDPSCPALVPEHEHYSAPRTYWGPEAGISILKTLRPTWEQLVAEGAIQLQLGSRVVELETQADRVTGAVVEHQDGSQQRIRAAATVLTTGGYAANPEVFAALTPVAPPLVTHSPETSTGDAIDLTRGLGAEVRNCDTYVTALGGFRTETGPGRIRDWRDGWALVGSARMRAPREIYVASDGRRFINEDETGNDLRDHAIGQLDRELFWVVFDEAALWAGECLIMGWENEDIVTAAATGEFCWRADTIADLANLAGLDPTGLSSSVAEYNEGVERGTDRLGRQVPDYPLTTPPFYAFRMQGCSILSWAGLTVNDQLQVLDERAQPIGGLYAAGEVLGMAATSGSAVVSGMSVTPAMSFGRWLGKRLAPQT
ncbi:MAG: FAD-dependent oxidoreductase [Gammaproteobacteria bacterium]